MRYHRSLGSTAWLVGTFLVLIDFALGVRTLWLLAALGVGLIRLAFSLVRLAIVFTEGPRMRRIR